MSSSPEIEHGCYRDSDTSIAAAYQDEGSNGLPRDVARGGRPPEGQPTLDKMYI